MCKTPVWSKAGPGLEKAWTKAQELLKKHGASVEEIELPGDFAKIDGWHRKVLAGEGRTSFLGSQYPSAHRSYTCCTSNPAASDYLLGKQHLHKLIVEHVENGTKLSRKDQLEAYDGCARLRPVWDKIARGYEAVITPSVPDEAPLGLESTGDAVST